MLSRVFLLLIFLFSVSNPAMSCLSITDDYNLPNPVLNAHFNLQPDIGPFTDCWSSAIRIRSKGHGWRLVANRRGPTPNSVHGEPEHNVKAKDIKLEFRLKNFGTTTPDRAILVYPFSSETNLSSIQSGTLIATGLKKTGNSCSIHNKNFYKLEKRLCLFRDFVFNVGEYNGEVTYLLVAP